MGILSRYGLTMVALALGVGASLSLPAAAADGDMILLRKVPHRSAYREAYPSTALTMNPRRHTQDALDMGIGPGGMVARELSDEDAGAVASGHSIAGATAAGGFITRSSGFAHAGGMAATHSATSSTASTMNSVMSSTVSAMTSVTGGAGSAVRGATTDLTNSLQRILAPAR